MQPSSRTFRAVAVAAAVSMGLAGCVAQPSNQVVLAPPPPDGTGCYDGARVPFYRISNTALVADQAQKNADDANKGLMALGAVATIGGLIAGGTVGNVIAGVGALATVASALALSVRTDQRIIYDFTNSFGGLAQCRQDEAFRVRGDVRARRITLTEGRDRLMRLRLLMQEDADVARRVNVVLSQRNQVYSVSAADVDTRLASEPDPQVRRQKYAEVAQARQTIQSNQRALTDQVTAINRASETITVSSIERFTPDA